MRASELYAEVENDRCEGRERCHWCMAPCTTRLKHDDVPFLPFVKSGQLPKLPSSPFTCVGCWHWRKGPVTVNFPGGGYLDRQFRKGHSWLITEKWAYALDLGCSKWLYQCLLKVTPGKPFALSITTNGERVPNLIHLMECNVPQKGDTAETTYRFTIDYAPFTYTVYELEEALKHGPDGKSAGVRELMRIFKTEPSQSKEQKVVAENRPVGRPPAGTNSEKEKVQEIRKMKRFLR